jgi:hypothetical protein
MVQNYFCIGFFIQDIIFPEKDWEICIAHLWNFKKHALLKNAEAESYAPLAWSK